MVTSIGATTKRSKLLKKAASCRSRNPPRDPPGARPAALPALPIRLLEVPGGLPWQVARPRAHLGRRAPSLETAGLLLREHGELVGPVVAGLVWSLRLLVPLDLPPPHFVVAPRGLQESRPQVPVRHGNFAVVEPPVLPPRLVPSPPHAVDEVGRVGVDRNDVPLFYSLQGDARGGHLHPQVGGVLLAAPDLLGLASPGDDHPVASGATGAARCTVGVGVSLRQLSIVPRRYPRAMIRSARA